MSGERKQGGMDPVRVIFGVAVLFAAGSVGFFVAVLLQNQKTAVAAPASVQLSEGEKVRVLEALSNSEDTQGNTLASLRGTSTKPLDPAAETKRKLDILKSLNAQ